MMKRAQSETTNNTLLLRNNDELSKQLKKGIHKSIATPTAYRIWSIVAATCEDA